nr:MmcB family DNA repair protein [Pusillimonas noertemannii]
MQLGPSGSPRPDVYSVPMSYARFQPIAYECKVSLSDFRADVTKGKWLDYLRFACAVIFAVPEGLIKKSDLPDGCGLIVRGPNGWRTVKGPTMRPLENLPRDAWVKLIIDGVRREAERNKPKEVSIWQALYAMNDRLGKQVAEAVRDRAHADMEYEHATEMLRQAARDADAEYRDRIQKAKDRANEDMSRIDSARGELAEALGLPRSASAYEIASAAHRAAAALDRDEVIRGLRQNFREIERAVESANAPMPAIARAGGESKPGAQP